MAVDGVSAPNRQPGWDKRAINQIASDLYDGLGPMFEAHGWATDGRVISQIAPTKVVQTYGSVEAFATSSPRPIRAALTAQRSDHMACG